VLGDIDANGPARVSRSPDLGLHAAAGTGGDPPELALDWLVV